MNEEHYLCPLHPNHSRRGEWDAAALATCQKRNLPSPEAVMAHVRKHHVPEWKKMGMRLFEKG